MILCNMELFVFRITADFYNFHTIQKRSRNILHGIGTCNKQYLGQIHRKLYIVIPEFMILFRVKHFQHGRSCISLIIAAHLVNFIQQHQWIFDSRHPQSIDDSSRHCSHIGSAVSADLRFIPHTSE